MSYPSWPTDLPRPRRDGYAAQRSDNRRYRPTEQGPPEFRRRRTLDTRRVSLSISVDRSQKAVFDTFFEETTIDGTEYFWMPDWVSDGWPLFTPDGFPLLTPDGAPLLMSSALLCCWARESMPQETLRGMTFLIVFEVEVLP